MDVGLGLGTVVAISLAVWPVALFGADRMRTEQKWTGAHALYWGSVLPLGVGDSWFMAFADLHWTWRWAISGVIGAVGFVSASEGIRAVAQDQKPSLKPSNDSPERPSP